MRKRISALLLAVLMLWLGLPVSASYGQIQVADNSSCCGSSTDFTMGFHTTLVERRTAQLQHEINAFSTSNVPHLKDSYLMPSNGNVKMLVLPVSFPDYPTYRENYNEQELYNSFFAEYDSELQISEQSVRGLYYKFSNGRMDLTGQVLPIYEAPEPSAYYEEDDTGPIVSGDTRLQKLYQAAIKFYADKGIFDAAEYDSDEDGYVDGLNVKFYLPAYTNTEKVKIWDPQIWSFGKNNKVGSKTIKSFTHTSITSDIWTDIHEIGHLLGLPDNYQGNCVIDWRTGEMMVADGPYFNSYYKYLLDWIDPLILTNDSPIEEISLYAEGDMSSYPKKAVVFVPDPFMLPFGEYFIAEYRTGYPEDEKWKNILFSKSPGIVIWHVDANLLVSGSDYSRGNYLQPVFKSGTQYYADKDIYVEGDVFSSDSTPVNSDFYDGTYTGAYLEVTDITSEKATIRAGFRNPDLTPPPTIEFSEPSPKAVRNGVLANYTVSFKYGGELIPVEELEFDTDYLSVEGTDGASGSWQVAKGNPKLIGIRRASGEGTLRLSISDGAVTYRGKKSRKITSETVIVDNTPPVITLKGETPRTHERGNSYTDPGADITDNLDPDIKKKLQRRTTVNTKKVGTYTVTYSATDHAGNQAEVKRTVIVEDTVAPTATVRYSTTAPTNGDVVATLVPSEDIRVKNNGGSLSHTFTENGSFTFEFEDLAGNQGTATATVANIDKSLPTGTVAYDIEVPTNGDVTATLTVGPGIQILNNGGRNTHVFTENGNFDFQIQNAAGTEAVVAATVNWIDKTAPTAEVMYSTALLTNQDVVATIIPSENVTVTNNDGGLSHTFTENGSFTFEFMDAAGNTGSATATVNWIDKIPPTAEVSYDPAGKTEGPVTATIEFTEPVTFSSGGEKLEATADELIYTMEFTENGSCEVQFEDAACNRGIPLTLAVTWIEEEPTPTPTPTSTATPTPTATPTSTPTSTPEFPPTIPPGPGPDISPEPSPPPEPPELPADIKGHWAEQAIAAVYERGIMTGYPDGTFQPERKLTRAELCSLMCRYLKLPAGTETGFSDVKGWSKGAIAALAKTGIVGGYEDGTFRPDQEISREEVAVILNNALNPEAAAPGTLYGDDGKIASWARQSVYNVRAQGWMTGDEKGNFNPKAKASRAEIASMMARLLKE